jgi:hypothetical protein
MFSIQQQRERGGIYYELLFADGLITIQRIESYFLATLLSSLLHREVTLRRSVTAAANLM